MASNNCDVCGYCTGATATELSPSFDKGRYQNEQKATEHVPHTRDITSVAHDKGKEDPTHSSDEHVQT